MKQVCLEPVLHKRSHHSVNLTHHDEDYAQLAATRESESESESDPRILEWVAYPFSRGSFQPRNRTGVSCIAGGWSGEDPLLGHRLVTRDHSEASYKGLFSFMRVPS